VLLGGIVTVYFARSGKPRTVQESLRYWSARYDLDVRLVRAVAWIESGNDPNRVSTTGARGVMQVEPGTWRYTESLIGHRVAPTPDGNVEVGVAYLHFLLLEFHGDRRLALAAYYQGPHAVRRFGVYPSAEHYVANVLAIRGRL
jgi:soluble lytic murein transglycosylase-like protein